MEHRPPPQPRVVLTEEDYTDTLSSIIQRDFFPQVPDLERQAAILERRSNHDFGGAVAVRRAARRLQQHEQALADQEALEETEGATDGNGDDHEVNGTAGLPRVRRTARPLHRESVTGFHARVTNADNAEFDQQQREELQATREHLEQVFRNGNRLKITNGDQTTQQQQQQQQQQQRTDISSTPLLASDAYTASPHRVTAAEWKPTEMQNGFFFTPSNNNNSKYGTSTSPTLLLTDSTTANSMPPPASKRKGGSTLALPDASLQSNNSLLEQHNLVEFIPKHVLEKKIEPSRTRFPTTLATFPQRPRHAFDTASTASSTEDYTTDASASTDLDAPPRSLEQEREARQKRQRRDQERLVVMTPLLAPGRDGVSASPIMTWGEVSSTPLVIGGAAAAASVEPSSTEQFFVLPAPSERDQRAAKAQSMLAKQARQRVSSSSQLRQSNAASATPKSRLDSLTPAARSLLEKVTGTSSRLQSAYSSSTPRSRDAFGTALRASYNSSSNQTPQRSSGSSSSSSSRLPSSSHSKRRKDAYTQIGATPRRTESSGLTQIPTSKTSSDAATLATNPTDGLLQLHG